MRLSEIEEVIDYAEKLGAAAYRAGLPCDPAQDYHLAKIQAGRRPGDGITLLELKGWREGWHKENYNNTGG